MSISKIEAWAWEIRTLIPEQKYIDLMDILKKEYDLNKYILPHKIKVVLTTAIKIASNDWIETHDIDLEDYDEIEADNDSPEEEIYIETDMIFNVNLKDNIQYYTDWDHEGNDKGRQLLFNSAYIEDYRNIVSNKNLLCNHLEEIASYKINSKRIYYSGNTEKTIAYIVVS